MKSLYLILALAVSLLAIPGAALADSGTDVHPDCAFTGAECWEPIAPPNTPAPATDIDSLLVTVLQVLPNWITEPLFQLVKTLVFVASVIMLLLRLLGWLLPSALGRRLAPVANALHWLTWLLDRLALNSGGKK